MVVLKKRLNTCKISRAISEEKAGQHFVVFLALTVSAALGKQWTNILNNSKFYKLLLIFSLWGVSL